MNTENLNRTVFISDNLPFLKALDSESVDLVVIDPPFGKIQTFEGKLTPSLTEAEQRIERELMQDWGVVDADTAYELGIEYPDQTGTTAKFEDIWDFRVRIYQDWLESLESICPGGYWLIQSTRYTHGDGTAAYIAFMIERALEIRRVLKTTGSVYLHCDHSANAYLRQMMDAVFGQDNFLNELIWERTRGRNDGKHWGNITDTILFYCKTKDHTWRNTYQKRQAGTADTAGDLTAPGIRRGVSGQTWKGYNPTDYGRHWAVPITGNLAMWINDNKIAGYTAIENPHTRLDALEAAGMVLWSENGRPSIRRPAESSAGAKVNNLWTDIRRATPSERTGYPTQKPQALARRMIEASSKPGDLVLDCFAGCAYVPVAAELTGRRWIACDMSPRAWTVVRRQFHKQSDLRIVTEGEYAEAWTAVQPDLGPEIVIQVKGPSELPERTNIEAEAHPLPLRMLPEIRYRQRPVESANEIWETFVEAWGTQCWYCGLLKRNSRRELQLDHVEPNKRDGSNDDCWNRALACVDCNGAKGDRLSPMETIDLALKEGRIATPMLRNEQAKVFEARRAWAQKRFEQVRNARYPLLQESAVESEI